MEDITSTKKKKITKCLDFRNKKGVKMTLEQLINDELSKLNKDKQFAVLCDWAFQLVFNDAKPVESLEELIKDRQPR